VNKTLATRVNEAAAAVRRNVHNPNLTQAQFDALVTYTYNMGPSGAFSVYRAASQGNNTAVADLMSQNIHVKKNGQYKVSLDLQARRVEESAPFRPRQK
jgi:lysozyme